MLFFGKQTITNGMNIVNSLSLCKLPQNKRPLSRMGIFAFCQAVLFSISSTRITVPSACKSLGFISVKPIQQSPTPLSSAQVGKPSALTSVFSRLFRFKRIVLREGLNPWLRACKTIHQPLGQLYSCFKWMLMLYISPASQISIKPLVRGVF